MPTPSPRLTADAPIGIFDSGFGGLTVARSVIDQLPHESVVYLGDTARQPYGQKPIGEVREYALECLDHLYDQGVKALVIACNSASAAMLRDARERYDVPVVEVILPGRPPGRGRHAQRPRRRDLHARDRELDGLRRRLRRRARTSTCTSRPARASSTSSSRASPAATSCSPPPTTTSTRWPPPGSTPSSSAAPTTRC